MKARIKENSIYLEKLGKFIKATCPMLMGNQYCDLDCALLAVEDSTLTLCNESVYELMGCDDED